MSDERGCTRAEARVCSPQSLAPQSRAVVNRQSREGWPGAGPLTAQAGRLPVRPSSLSCSGASSGTGTAGPNTPIARHSSACGESTSQSPSTRSVGSFVSAPITYQVDGKQFVSVIAGNVMVAFGLKE